MEEEIVLEIITPESPMRIPLMTLAEKGDKGDKGDQGEAGQTGGLQDGTIIDGGNF